MNAEWSSERGFVVVDIAIVALKVLVDVVPRLTQRKPGGRAISIAWLCSVEVDFAMMFWRWCCAFFGRVESWDASC